MDFAKTLNIFIGFLRIGGSGWRVLEAKLEVLRRLGGLLEASWRLLEALGGILEALDGILETLEGI